MTREESALDFPDIGTSKIELDSPDSVTTGILQIAGKCTKFLTR